MRAILLAAPILLALAGGASAHDAPSGWTYPPSCCNGGDCGQVPHGRVKPAPGGWRVTLSPGDNPMVTDKTGPVTVIIPADRTQLSPDREFHICLWPTHRDVRCFWAPEGGA
jgi:hypothetical protein